MPDRADDVADAVQIALWRLSQCTPAPENPEAWMARVAWRILLDEFRAEARRPMVPLSALPTDAQSPAPTLSGTTTGTLSAELVSQVLQGLPDRDRALLRAMYVEGRPARALAEEIGVKESGMGRIMDRARQRFRRLFRAAIDERRKPTPENREV